MSEFDPEIIKDPRIFMQNRLSAHSDHEWTDLRPDRTDGSDKYLLNGGWRFHFAENPASAAAGFEQNDFDESGWDYIQVPGHIELQGYGQIQYVNYEYPWDGHEEIEPGQIPVKYNPVGQYVKRFTLPSFMQEGPVYISFQGAESGLAVWLNGHYVGYSEDSFTPSEFDLTPFVDRKGENRLAVEVFKYTSGSWCEDQDFFRFSGLFRDVYLYTVPQIHVWDMRIVADPDDDMKDGILTLSLDTRGAEGRAVVSILDSGHNTVAETVTDVPCSNITLTVKDVAKWSAEKPYLYDLRIEIVGQELIEEKIGFRRFEIRDGVMCINGERIVFNGVNRHEFSAYRGRAIGEDEIRTDLITMKQNNINAIRTCHYPNQTALYREADRLGLYVIDETNLETHGVWDHILRSGGAVSYAVPGDREEYRDMVLDRAESMLRRDRNHACILIWSLGNEAFNGSNFVAMHDFFRKNDPSRLVHYEGVRNDERYPDVTDMISVMYWPVAKIEEYLSTHRDKPFISCEYSHAMGNSCGGISEYTELAKRERLYQGGFIWDYIDQAIVTKDAYGREYLGYGGDFGDRPNDGSFSGDGLCHADMRKPTPKMQEVKKVYSPIDISFTDTEAVIKNNSLFTNTDIYDCHVSVCYEDRKLYEDISSISAVPGETVSVPLPMYNIPRYQETVVTVSFSLKEGTLWAKKGAEIAFGQKTFGKRAIEHAHDGSGLNVVHGWHNTGVEGADFTILFSDLYGGLVSYRKQGRELIKKMPRPNFWRPLTENDIGNHLPFRAAQWRSASSFLYAGDGTKPFDRTIEEKDGIVTLTYTYGLPVRPAKKVSLSYTVYSDGTVQCSLKMDASADVGELPEFGVMFEMDASFNKLRWYGMGPDDTYADRETGGRLGVWSRMVSDNMASYLRPQECGNHTHTRWLEVTDASGRGIRFEGRRLSVNVLPWSPDMIDAADHPYELPPVHSTFVRIDKAQEGVGGDDSWGARPLNKYLIDNTKPLLFGFTFRGI